MRVVLFTGKGGVGKTTAAAGTAVLTARAGLKTLVLSTDSAHSLADALAVQAGPEPVEALPGLAVQQVDTQRRFQAAWGDVRDYLLTILDTAGVDSVAAEELTVLPGADELLALLELRDQVRSGRWDVVVVDCAPTAETLRLLTLPDVLGWFVDRVFPLDRQVVRSLRPVLGKVAGLPMPRDGVLEALARLHGELAEVRTVLDDPGTSVRLVLTPESVVVAEARRTLTSLSLFGYKVDAVMANRIFPASTEDGADGDGWLRGWVDAQRRVLADVEQSFAPLPVLRGPYCADEPVGVDRLAALAEQMYGDLDPVLDPPERGPFDVERSGDEFVLTVALPFADRDDMDLVRSGDELVLSVGSARRVLALPSALRRCTVVGAALRDGVLRIRFEPDPSMWRGL